MSIQRGVLPGDSFTIIPNDWLRDGRLSAKAKGLLCYIASHKSGYNLTIRQVLREMSDGEAAVRSGLEELEKLGYLRRHRLREEDGRMGSYEWSLGEVAGQSQNGFSSVENSSVANQVTKKTTTPSEKKTTQSTSDADAPNGGSILKDWIDYLSAQGVKTLPAQTKARYGKELKQALADGFEVRLIKHALALLFQRGKVHNPQLLPSLLIEVQSTRSVSGPPAAKPYVQLADEYKADKAKFENLCTRLAQELIDQGMDGYSAVKKARELAEERTTSQETVDTSRTMPYIEGDWEPTTPREVTGS